MHRTVQQGLLNGGIDDNVAGLFGEWLKAAAAESNIRIFKSEFEMLTRTGENMLLDPIAQQIMNSIKSSTPEQVEIKIEFQVPGVPFPVLGYIDLIDDDGRPYDIKTSRYDWEDGKAELEVQPDFYLTALDIAGDTRHQGNFTHLIMVKNEHAPSVYTMDTTRTGYRERVFEMVQKMWAGVQAEEWKAETVRPACSNCRMKAPCYYNK